MHPHHAQKEQGQQQTLARWFRQLSQARLPLNQTSGQRGFQGGKQTGFLCGCQQQQSARATESCAFRECGVLVIFFPPAPRASSGHG